MAVFAKGDGRGDAPLSKGCLQKGTVRFTEVELIDLPKKSELKLPHVLRTFPGTKFERHYG